MTCYGRSMLTVTMRELKQNPQEIVRRATEGQDFEVTSYGRGTGVWITSRPSGPRRWVPGGVFAAAKPLTTPQAEAWKRDIESALEDSPVADPWTADRSHP
jgi:prevent-host-death family protein